MTGGWGWGGGVCVWGSAERLKATAVGAGGSETDERVGQRKTSW